jgi:pantoate--beta-alanine ligase
MPELLEDPREWQRRCRAARQAGRRVALVPTMGYLHEGHASLLREARRLAGPGGLALATIFVNPTQFGPREDLSRYPRDLPGDLARCDDAGIDWVLAPAPEAVYHPLHQTWVEVEGLTEGLCGASRPGHFRGVATVVTKLLLLSRPDVALFGEKDWQQLQVIRALVRDLDLDVEIAGMPIVREADGLALSSRNAYLSPEGRVQALALSRTLFAAQERCARGERGAEGLRARAAAELGAAGVRVDYVEVVHPETLRPVAEAAPGSRMLVAGFVGATRLIDNVSLP